MKYILFLSLINFSLLGQVKTLEKGYKTNEGMLHFSNAASFIKTFNYLISISNDEKLLSKWELENKISSNRNLVNDIYEEYKDNPELLIDKIKRNSDLFYFNVTDSTYNEIIQDKVLAAISNRKGLFKVGDEYVKVVKNYIIKWKSKLLYDKIENEINFRFFVDPCPGCDTIIDKILKLSNEIKVERYKTNIDQIESIARGNGPCKGFNEVAAYQGNRKIKLQLFLITLYNNTYIVCGSHSYKHGIKYRTKHTLDIYSIKVQLPSSTWTKTNLTNYSCDNVMECTPVYSYIGSGSNYSIIQANIRATHRGMDGTYTTFVCP